MPHRASSSVALLKHLKPSPAPGSKHMATASAAVPTSQQHSTQNKAPHGCITLAFKDRCLEALFGSWYDEAATAHDVQVSGEQEE